MPNVNIRRDVDDKFYRYKMPVLETKIEGRGNGIKTVIPNMADIAKALARPAAYPTKFFGIELGAQSKVDDKNERYIVNGVHDAPRLRDVLDVFIDKFVLCGSCKNPETFFVINAKAGDAWRDCKACGARTPLDLRHKLTSFIIKNPPPPEKKVKGLKSGAENSTAANAEAIMGISRPSMMDEAPPASSGAPAAGGDADEGQDAEVNEDEIPDVDGRSDDDDWAEDMSPEAVAARERELAGQLKNSMILGDQEGGDDDDEDEDSPYYQLKVWIQQERGKADQKAVLAKVKELGIEKKHKAVLVLSEWLFTENAVKEIPQFSKLFTALVSSEKHQKALLGGVERLTGVHYPALIADVPKLLMAYYQDDILDEEVVTNWGTHVSKKYTDKDTSKKVRKAAGSFLKWLAEADDESD